MPAPSNNMGFDKPAQIGLAEKRMNTKLGNKQEKEERGKHNLHKKRRKVDVGKRMRKSLLTFCCTGYLVIQDIVM
jgi:hypothetical protein